MSKKHSQETVDKIIELKLRGVSSRKIAEEVFGKKTAKSSVNDIYKRFEQGKVDYSKSNNDMKSHLPKVLLFDIETSPNKLMGWSLWNQNFGLNQIESEWFVLSYAAKWLGKDDVIYEDMEGIVDTENDSHILDSLWKLFDEADVIIGQNSKAFDVKKMNARWILNGYKPTSPYKQIDTLDIAKRNFAFTSRKLEWMTDKLCDNKKLTHQQFAGFELWKQCLLDNPDAWTEMREYNIMDVISLEELYIKMAAWDNKHVNFNLYTDSEEHVCRCGSSSIVEAGYAYTGVSKFQQYRCLDCGATTRGRKNLLSKEKRDSLHMNIGG
jgi:DNA polymerase III epsilon subunit-like protein